MKRIKRFGVYQTAKVAAVIYFALTAIMVIPIALFSLITAIIGGFGDDTDVTMFSAIGGVAFLIIPFIYGLVMFVMTALGCALYNYIVRWTGGIELEVEVAPTEPRPAI